MRDLEERLHLTASCPSQWVPDAALWFLGSPSPSPPSSGRGSYDLMKTASSLRMAQKLIRPPLQETWFPRDLGPPVLPNAASMCLNKSYLPAHIIIQSHPLWSIAGNKWWMNRAFEQSQLPHPGYFFLKRMPLGERWWWPKWQARG